MQEWVHANPDFAADYARARLEGYEAIAADCLAIADDSSGDVIETEAGPRQNSEFAARSKLRIETRLRLLRSWYPAKYGDRIAVEDATPAKTLSREETLAQLRASGLSVADIFGAVTKAAEPIPLEIEPSDDVPDDAPPDDDHPPVDES